jgi:hypothetical protein
MKNLLLVCFLLVSLFILTFDAMIKIQTSGTMIVKADGTIRLGCTCTGDRDKLITPWQDAFDGDWNTKLAWNNSLLGDFSITITENYSLPAPAANATWEFKAYHCNNGSLIPTPFKIECWNGSSWISLYQLDDQEHVNEEFIETINIPNTSISDKMTLKTTIMYSSHVVGAILPNPPERLLQYVEYFEGELTEQAIPELQSILLVLPLFMMATLLAVTVYRKKHVDTRASSS